MLTTPRKGQTLSCIGCGKGAQKGTISMGQSRDSIRKMYRRGEPVAAIACELAKYATRSTSTRGWRNRRSHPRRGSSRPSKMDRWALLVDPCVAHRRLQGEQEAEAISHRVWRRLVDECGADVPSRPVRRCVREASARLGVCPGLLPRPRLARGGRAGRLRPRGVRREGHEARDAPLRRELPHSNVGSPRRSPARTRGKARAS